ncbi:ASCH domain-containing protein [Calidifontibacillus oryziterrae]|uniref:hypothetical protein n=1 Tax=Calidifontibacillus oryziterrae TaxID=1191699 RepID=UPI00030EB317|nr:hypothetical protein [Calidifontibacillus oryziterrae]
MAGHPTGIKLQIENLITNEMDVTKVISGEKTAVRRHGKFAEVGEVLELKGSHYQITSVYQQANKDMTNEDANKEGYKSIEEYRQHVQDCHKITTLKWEPEKLYWVHELKKIN